MRKVNFIVVGSGIAGISIAWELYFRNKSFVLISQPSLSSSSLVAPGIVNPIVFKRIIPTWNAAELIDTLLPFYQSIEKIIKYQLLHSVKIYHVLNNINEEQLWKQKKELYPAFLNDIKVYSSQWLKTPIKCGEVSKSFRLNTAAYIYYSLEFFKSINSFSEQVFNYDAFNIHSDSLKYFDITANYIIFCEGYLIKNNPFFSFIHLKPAKGEIVEIETEHSVLTENTILHKNISIISIQKNRYLIGSNYDWNDLSEKPTSAIKESFLQHFENLFNVKYQIIGHYAGIRPAFDRRPIIGKHPNYNNLYVLNGLGTKGVMLAPFSVKLLADNLLENKPIPRELVLDRFIV